MIGEGPGPNGFDERIERLSLGKLDLLFQRLRSQVVHAVQGILPAPRHLAGSPLSFAQERLWFLDALQPGSAVYNMPAAFRLAGPLDAAALERALAEVMRRHEVLRTTFASAGGRPVQIVA